MKRLLVLASVVLLAGFALAAENPPATAPAASDNLYANDFTKGMGAWKLNKAEGKQDQNGLKITKSGEYGGIIIDDNKKADLSHYKWANVTFVNNENKAVEIVMKIGSGEKDKRTAQPVTLPQGENTLSFKLEGAPVDLAAVNYLNFWFNEEGERNIIIKDINFTAAALPAPVKQNP
jgi:hypothetical protein